MKKFLERRWSRKEVRRGEISWPLLITWVPEFLISFPNCLVTFNFLNTPWTFVISPFPNHVFHKTIFITDSEPWGYSLLNSTLLLFHPTIPLPPSPLTDRWIYGYLTSTHKLILKMANVIFATCDLVWNAWVLWTSYCTWTLVNINDYGGFPVQYQRTLFRV